MAEYAQRRWTIQEVARLAGISSRTLRHYDEIGLLRPAFVGVNGYRHYDEAAFLRLQRIMLLRDMGMSLAAIGTVLSGDVDDLAALRTHLAALEDSRVRVERQIEAVSQTIARRQRGEALMPDEMFRGFDHEQYRDEVEQRWGADAYAASDRWWRELGDSGQQQFMAESAALAADWQAAAAAGEPVDGDVARALAVRHHAWVARSWGDRDVAPEALLGLAQMYVADDRFARHYGGVAGATFVRDALTSWVSAETR